MNGFFIILTAVLSSGVVAAVISASFTEAKERWVFRRQKIEEIYLAAAKWLRSMDVSYMPYIGVCKGELSYKVALETQLEKTKDIAQEIGDNQLRMIMNIEMYEPALAKYVQIIEDEKKKLNGMVFSIRENARTGKTSLQILKPFSDQWAAFGVAGDNLKAAIVARGAYIAAEPNQLSMVLGKARLRITSTNELVASYLKRKRR